MRTVTHRELRNNSSAILREVAAGGVIEVTNHGQVAAVLVPPALAPYDRLVAAGRARLPDIRSVDLRLIQRRPPLEATASIIADTRGRW